MPEQKKTFEATRKDLLDAMSSRHHANVEERVLPFTNDDVPQFLRRLDDFEAASRKIRLRVS